MTAPVPTPPTPSNKASTIRLQNPVTHLFAPFIFGNATQCEAVCEQGSAAGQQLVLCGAGPSLRETAAKWCPAGDQVWGCNSAAMWLHAHGHKVTHAFTVDQTAHMQEEWAPAPDLEYLVASSVYPFLVDFLISKNRRVRFFHNFCGVPERPVAYATCDACEQVGDHDIVICPNCGGTTFTRGRAEFEDWLYMTLYPPTCRAGSGLNAVTRAIDVALFMGFDRITLLGADCAIRTDTPPPRNVPVASREHMDWLRDHTMMHADGGSALASEATPVTMRCRIDGRTWTTKPDMMISADWLVKMKQRLGPRLRIMGDTLPKALLAKSSAWLDEHWSHLTGADGEALPFPFDETLYGPEPLGPRPAQP